MATDETGSMYVCGSFTEPSRFGTTVLSCECLPRAIGPCYDLFMAKYDSNTNLVWLRHVADAGGRSLAVHGTNWLVVVGEVRADTQFESTRIKFIGKGQGIFIAKYSTVGNLLWVRHFGGTGVPLCSAVAVDLDGNIIVAGWFGAGSVDLGGTIIENGERAAFVAKYDSQGKLLWARVSQVQQPASVAADAQGNIYLTGVVFHPPHNDDMYLAKYDRNGTFEWASSPGGAPSRFGRNVAVDREGNPHVVGTIKGTRDFGTLTITNHDDYFCDLFIAKYNADGGLVSARQFRRGDFDFEHTVSLRSATSIGTNVNVVALALHARAGANFSLELFGALPAVIMLPHWQAQTFPYWILVQADILSTRAFALTDTVALWVLHTYAFKLRDVCAYLVAESSKR